MSNYLLNKFRGAWLGSLIGQELADHNQQILMQEQNAAVFNLPLERWFFPSTPQIVSTLQKQGNLLAACQQRSCNIFSGQDLTAEASISKKILLILPIILYYHDDWCSLSSFLRQQRNSSQQSQQEIDNILVWCYTVRLAIRGELVCHDLTDCVVTRTGIKQTSSIQWLKAVEVSCMNGFDSIQLIKKLASRESWEMALSLFCFLNNPQDFYLTIQQALFLEQQTETTNIAALSGVLSGAYNSWTEIPVNWRNLAQNQDFYQQISTKTKNMLAEWWGLELSGNPGTLSSVITSPKILQSRSELRIISQQEY